MDGDGVDDISARNDDILASELKMESNVADSIEVEVMSSGETMEELENAGEMLTSVELDLACHSEKLLNLEILVMHLGARESDFEAFVSEKEATFGDSAKKALEFDLLSGILESELNVEEKSLVSIRSEIDNTFSKISSCQQPEGIFKEMQENLHDCGKSLKQSLEQVSEMRLQCDNFKRILSSFPGGKNDKDRENLENGYFSDMNSKIRMQTSEQKRHVLRQLEKSLARELDLENKLTELSQSEKLFKLSLQQQLFRIEEEVEATGERLFEAENAAEVLLGKSRELMGRLQMAQFNLNGSIQREAALKSKFEELNEQSKVKDDRLRNFETINAELREKANSLEKQLEESKLQVRNLKASEEKMSESDSKIHEMENTISSLRGNVSEAENRAENAEAGCKVLRDSNMELNKDLNLVRTSNSVLSDKINLLEKQFGESDIQLQHAVASAEASMEKQTMLYSTIKDMENLIDDLKSKVVKAENHTESVEEKCIILSEANSDLNVELNFVRSRMEYLEATLHQTEETKKATAKDISIRTKLITELIVQLAVERERLHKQISLLTKERRVLLKRLQKTSEDHSVNASDTKDSNKNASSVEETKGKTTELSATNREPEKARAVLAKEAENVHSDFTADYGTVRNIDPRQLNFKYIIGAIFVFAISALVVSLLQGHGDQFESATRTPSS